MDQDKFWQMHDTIFANQGAAENAGAFSNSNLKAMARSIGVDTVTFDSCLDSAKYDTVISEDRDEGTAAGVDQTPTTVINGKKSIAVMGPDDLKRAFAEIAPDVKFP